MVRIDDGGDVTKCWLDREEVGRLERAAGQSDWEREIAMQLMARCGFRVDEVNYPGDAHLRWSEKGDCWFVEVRGKNTSGGDPKVRDAWIPEDVEEDIRKFSRERGRGNEPWVDKHVDTIRGWVKAAAEEIAEQTGDERWRHVSSHDLRRSWAQHWLVEENKDVRTMMAIGGWSSYSAIEPYLREPTDGRIGAVMGAD